MKNITLIFVFIFITASISSQVTQEWIKTYQGYNGAYVEACDFEKDISGNLLIAGYSINPNNRDFLLLKYDVNGTLIFSSQYDSASEGACSLTSDPGGNIYITGDGTGSGTYTMILKYSPSGNLLWSSLISSVNNELWSPVDIKYDRNYIYVAGNVRDENGDEVYIAKYGLNGNRHWLKKYGSPFDSGDYLKMMQIDNAGNIYLCGNTVHSVTHNDYLLVRYDTNGNMLWGKNIGDGNSENTLNASYIDGAGNIYLTGSSLGSYFTVKCGPGGSEIWRRYYSGVESGNRAEAICGDESGNIFVTGQSKDSTIINYNIATLKYNAEGVLLWSTRYSGPGLNYDIPCSISWDNNNNLYVSGFITNSNNNRDFISLNYSNSGTLKWNQSYNSSGWDESIGIFCDHSGNVYVSGNCTNSGNSSIVTIKYSQLNAINNMSSEIPGSFSLSQNYPNPFNPETRIRFQIPPTVETTRRVVSLEIYDILGKQVSVLVNQQLQPGVYEVNWDASAFPSGIYFYTLRSGSFTETHKMVLLK
jgi:hypothetical protein